MARLKPLLLIILDGFGISLEKTGNPVAEAKKPALDEIEHNFPFTTLQASGTAVGLPWGEAGNSEVGHLTIGAGRAIHHHLPRIIYSIRDGSFFKNEALLKAAEHTRLNKSRLHIAGLISSGSVHSYIDHLYALLEFTKKEKIEQVFLHVFTDGKDAPPKEGAEFFAKLEEKIKKEWPQVYFASVIGRFYALDRDDNWDRIKKTYELLTGGKGEKITSVSDYLRSSYEKEITDEFVEPAVVIGEGDGTSGLIRENDVLIFSDFREDSMRELTRAFVEESFEYFPRKKLPNLLVVTMTEYQKGFAALPAFPQLDINWSLGRVLSEAGLRQLRIAESQKYAHLTYFLNGGQEKPFFGEDRILIPSLATAHFDEMPEMKTREITAGILENFDKYDVIIANFANADMVGHSGNFAASLKAVEIIDESIGQLANAFLNSEGAMLITADHGNIELKRDRISGEKLTEHSTNPVPLYLVGKDFRLAKVASSAEILERKKKVQGILTDVAPTLLALLDLKKPPEMTGQSLRSILKTGDWSR